VAFDFKKEYKEFYMPKNKPGIVTVPSMNYIAGAELEIRIRRMENIRSLSDCCMELPSQSR